LREALAACSVDGPKTNIAFLEALVRHPAVVEARIDTGYLDRHLDEFIAAAAVDEPALLLAAHRVPARPGTRAARRGRGVRRPHLAVGAGRRLAAGPRRATAAGVRARRRPHRPAGARPRRRLP